MIHSWIGREKPVFPGFFRLLLCLTLCGCQLGYIAKSAYHQADILRRRIPLAQALQNPQLTEHQRRQIQLAIEVRSFMADTLDLEVKSNYATYVHLDRDYVTYAVSAAPKDQLEPHTWSFPIIGSVPYKGYFQLQDAKDEKKSLAQQNLDVYLRGVSAHSTLGWFSDPLLSSMLQYKEHQLVNTLIHETIHANLYIRSASKFNERVASFLATLGTEEFYADRGEGDRLDKILRESRHDSKVFSKFISAEIAKLRDWYNTHRDKPNLMELRKEQFAAIHERFKTHALPQMKTQNYHYFSDVTLNNARLLLYDLYVGDQDDFEKLTQQKGRSFHTIYKLLKTLEDQSDPEAQLRQWANAKNP